MVERVLPQLGMCTRRRGRTAGRGGRSDVAIWTSSGQARRDANLLGRLHLAWSATRAHTSLRRLGPAIAGMWGYCRSAASR